MKSKVLLVKEEKGSFVTVVDEIEMAELLDGQVLIKNQFSSLNYKDCLSITGNKGITRNYPHVPGIDAAGVVVKSKSKSIKEGDDIIVTGYDLGMNTYGGFAEYVIVPEDWVVAKPKKLSLKMAMTFGTAGLTAAIAIDRLERLNIDLSSGNIAVTGATGGVGSIACAVLSGLGFCVSAVTRKLEEAKWLQELGVKDFVQSDDLLKCAENKKPLLSKQWIAAIDNLGGKSLEGLLKTTDYYGAVVSCGNVIGVDFSTSVFPFILRGASLLGVSSANCPMSLRFELWDKIAKIYQNHITKLPVQEVTLDELPSTVDAMLNGKVEGRVVVNLP